MTVTNQNLIQEEIKRRLNSGNACYHSVQNFFQNWNIQDYNMELHILYSSPSIISSMNWGEEECIRVIGEKTRRIETAGKTKTGGWIILRWIFYRIGWCGLDWSSSG
jgi:hypothetical protein